MSASRSSRTRMRQCRRQMKKTKVFRGFTNQLKEVRGRLWGKGGVTGPGNPCQGPRLPELGLLTWASPEALALFSPSQPAGSLPPPQSAVQTPPQPSPRRRWRGRQWTQSSPERGMVIRLRTVRMWTLPPVSVNARSSGRPFLLLLFRFLPA